MLFTNTLAQSIRVLSGFVLAFVLAPIMLARLGLAAFGVWAVTGALATYAGLLDLGITRSLSRFVALFDARGEERHVRECFGLGLLVVTALGLIAVALAAVLAPLATKLLGVLSVHDMRIVLLSSAVILVGQGYTNVLEAIPVGLRRMVAPSVAGTVGTVLYFAASVTALLASRHLKVYAVANAAAAVVAILPAVIALVHVRRGLLPALPRRPLLKEVVGFGARNQVTWLADLVNNQTDKIVIASVIGVRAAGAYELAARAVGAMRAASVLTVSAMIPTMTAVIAEHGRSVIREHYRTYTRRAVALAFPVFVLGCVASPFVLLAWLGEVPARSQPILVVMALAYLVQLTTEVASTTALADGNVGMVASNAVLGAGVNIALTVALAPFFGLWGVLAGTLLAIVATSVLLIVKFHRRYGLPPRDYLFGVGTPFLLAVGLGIPFAALAVAVGTPGSRGAAAILLASVSILYALAYWVSASRLGLLPERLTLKLARPRVASGA